MASTSTTGVSANAPGVMTGKPLIESDRVEGTAVYDPQGNHIGSIKRLIIDKVTGKVAYTVMSFGGFLGIGEEGHTVPWNKLDYDTQLGSAPMSQRSSCAALRPSIGTATLIGRTGNASASCMIIGTRPTTGVFDHLEWPMRGHV